MSTSIKIQNFQSIESADIEADGFTILVGESSQGKSACLRAVSAACNNRFRQNYLKYGEETMTVEIGYNDEGSFKTTKNKKDSPTYSLNGVPYEKLNRTVPQEIADFNNHGVIDYYEQKYPLSFFSQFSKPLLLEFSQKRILEILSSSKAYDDMTKANSSLNRHKEQNGGAFKQVNAMLDTNKAKLSELKAEAEAQTALVENLKTLMESESKAEAANGGAEALSGLLTEGLSAKGRLRACERFVGLVLKQRELAGSCDKAEALDGEIRSDVGERLKAAEARLALCGRVRSLLDKRDGMRVDLMRSLAEDLDSLAEGGKRLAELESRLSAADALLGKNKEITALNGRLERLGLLSDACASYSEAKEALRKKETVVRERICPVCGSRLG